MRMCADFSLIICNRHFNVYRNRRGGSCTRPVYTHVYGHVCGIPGDRKGRPYCRHVSGKRIRGGSAFHDAGLYPTGSTELDDCLRLLQSVGLGGERAAALAAIALEDYKAFAVEGFALVGLEAFERYGVAIVHSGDEGVA